MVLWNWCMSILHFPQTEVSSVHGFQASLSCKKEEKMAGEDLYRLFCLWNLHHIFHQALFEMAFVVFLWYDRFPLSHPWTLLH